MSAPLAPLHQVIFADAGYRGQKTAAAIAKTGTWKLTIVNEIDLHGFAVLPKRWIVERTLAWISHSRRLAEGLATERSPMAEHSVSQ